MSWSASGAISLENQEANFDALVYSPELEHMTGESLEQAEFLKDVIVRAAEQQLLEGDYSLSMSGHSDTTVDGSRQSMYFSCSPVAGSSERVAE